jgi:O-6-methylguanine DNA methyltransferase
MDATLQYTVFDTPIGPCGAVWGPRGLAGILLPAKSPAALRRRLRERYPSAREAPPSADMARVIAAIGALLRGQGEAIAEAALDFDGIGPFHRRVYEAARSIPPGTTLTYGEVAQRLGSPGAARAVGQALARNPFAVVVPCHRVVAAGGKWGGFTADGGVVTKRRLLELETPVAAASRPAPLFAASEQSQALPFDPQQAIAHLNRVDPKLGRFIQDFGGFGLKLKGIGSAFGALAEAIVHQQLTGKAAATIWGRVCALESARGVLSPEWAARASVEALRSAGLSNSKALGIRDLAAKTLSGEVPTLEELVHLSNEDVVQRLVTVRGIGKWTVEMLLIFRLGRPDVLPIDDYGVRKGFAAVFRKSALPTPKELAAYGERWAPYRTVASWYLWRAADALKA